MAPKKYADLKDVTILPASFYPLAESDLTIKKDKLLPIMAAPSPDIINNDNIGFYKNAGFIPVCPRKMSKKAVEHDAWFEVTYGEFVKTFCDAKTIQEWFNIYKAKNLTQIKIFMDITGAVPKDIGPAIVSAKVLGRMEGIQVQVIVSPVISPDMYRALALHECDGCVMYDTLYDGSPVKYPMATLIHDTFTMKEEGEFNTQIIAGGIQTISDGIKALGIGADYIMMDRLMCTVVESARAFEIGDLVHHYDGSHYITIVPLGGGAGNVYDTDGNSKYRQLGFDELKSIANHRGSVKQIPASFRPNFFQTNRQTDPITIGKTTRMLAEDFMQEMKMTLLYTGNKSIDDFIGNAKWDIL